MSRKVSALLASLLVLAAIGGPAMTMRFEQQQQSATPVDNPVLLASADAMLLEDFWFYETGIKDVRAYNSYALAMSFDGGTWPDDGVIDLYVTFYADAAGTTEIFREKYQFFFNSEIPLTDQMHGPYMQIAVEDSNSIGESVELTYRLFGSYRIMSNAYLRTSDIGRLYEEVRVGLAPGTDDGGGPALLGYGPAMLSVRTDQVPVTVDIRIEGTSVNAIKYQLTLTAVGQADKLIILPRSAAWIVATNNAAAAATIRMYLVQQVQPL